MTKISILMIGKTSKSFIKDGFETYLKRISNYINIQAICIPDIPNRKNMAVTEIKQREANEILKKDIEKTFIVLLDEKGKQFSSTEFAEFFENKFNSSYKEIVFIIGGAYGVDERIKKNANLILSVSSMTFTHQFVRLILSEQIYRAFSIIKNEPYHNE